jgi:hypothetical protein
MDAQRLGVNFQHPEHLDGVREVVVELDPGHKDSPPTSMTDLRMVARSFSIRRMVKMRPRCRKGFEAVHLFCDNPLGHRSGVEDQFIYLGDSTPESCALHFLYSTVRFIRWRLASA